MAEFEIKGEKINLDWIEIDNDDNFIIDTKDGKFLMEEPKASVVYKSRKLSNITKHDTKKILIAESLIQPKLTVDDIDDLKASTLFKLEMAIALISDMIELL